LGSRLGLSCLRTPKPTFNDQLEEVHLISPKPSQESDTPTPLWIKRHALGAALLPGEKYDEDDEEDCAESSCSPTTRREMLGHLEDAWFCGRVECATDEATSFAVAEDAQDSPCSTDEYDQTISDIQESPQMTVSVLQALPVEASDKSQLDVNSKESRRSLKRWHSSPEVDIDLTSQGKENAAPPAKRRCSFHIGH
jgi:hypothetical protein